MKKYAFVIYTIIAIIFFGILWKLEYATDTYQVFHFNSKQIFMQFAMSGRFLTAITGSFIKLINVADEVIYIFSYILAIICIILSQYKIFRIIEKDIQNKILKILIPTLIIINPFSIELFLFIEKGIMIFGILMCIYALENLIKFFENNQKKYIMYASVIMLIANCSYQGVVGIFVAVALVYIIKYSKNIKQFLVNNIIVGLIYGIPAIIDYIIVKIIFSQSRVNGKIVISESLEKIFSSAIEMIKYTYSILPKYLFILAIVFTFGILWCKIIKEKRKVLEIFKYIYIIIGVIFISIIPQLMQPTSSIWFVPRATYGFASLFGILILYLSINYEMKNIDTIVILLMSFIILGFQLQKFIQIEKDRYILNEKDYDVTEQIVERIEKYELKTKNKITKITIYEDSNVRYSYDGISPIRDTNIKSYFNDWSTIAILNYYLNRSLKKIDKDQSITKYFSEKNWNDFDEKQLIFKDDILILCKY